MPPDMSKLGFSAEQFGQHIRPLLTLKKLGKTVERRARLQPGRKRPARLTARQAAERFSYATNLNLVLGVSAEVRFRGEEKL
jgi:hypothetical protein